MTTKNRDKIKRTTMKTRNIHSNYIVKKLMEISHNIQLIYETNNSIIPECVFNEIFSRINTYVKIFITNFSKLPANQISKIESTIKNIKYNNEFTLRSKLFEYIQILNELNLLIDQKKNKNIMETRDNIIDEIQRFIYFLNDSTYQKATEF